jgi:hypothetical protein
LPSALLFVGGIRESRLRHRRFRAGETKLRKPLHRVKMTLALLPQIREKKCMAALCAIG